MRRGKLLLLISLYVLTEVSVIMAIYAFFFEKDPTVGSLLGGLSPILALIIYKLDYIDKQVTNENEKKAEKRIIILTTCIIAIFIIAFLVINYLSKPVSENIEKNSEEKEIVSDIKDIVYLDLSSQDYSCDANPTNITTTISTDNPWNAKCNSPWIKTNKKGNTLDINIDANLTATPRKGTIFIDAGNMQKTFVVTQSNKKLKCDNLLSKTGNEQYWVAIYNNFYGFVDDNHETVIDFKYNYASSFYEDYCLVKLDNKYGYINRKGEIIIENIYNEGLDFSGGLAAVRDDRGWGFVDKVGNLIIETDFEDVLSSFNDKGIARIKRFGQVYYIDKQGRRVDY